MSLLACLTPILPLVFIWLFRRRWPLWNRLRLTAPAVAVWLLSMMPVCLVLTIGVIEATAIGAPAGMVRAATVAGNGRIYDGYEITNGKLHGLAGWQGVDIAAGCGAEIYAPFSGRVTHNGLDGYATSKGQATMLTIRGDGLEVTLLHGDYLPDVGTAVSAGEVIGYENNHGYTVGLTGCHSHVILRVNGQTLNYLDWLRIQPLRLAQAGQKPLKVSWYDPSLCYDASGRVIANTNCDGDPTTMASGEKVTEARYGRSAACLPEWTRARRIIVIPGLGRFECLDTGGAIKEHAGFIWIDLLLHQPAVPFGTLIDDWYLE